MKSRNVPMPTDNQLKKIREACPQKAPAEPAKPRRILVWGHSWTHQPNPFAEKMIEILGEVTGAFKAVVSDDPRLLLEDRLSRFDALVMNNIHERDPFLPEGFAALDAERKTAAKKFDEAVKRSILKFVKSGKGIVGTHAGSPALEEEGEIVCMIQRAKPDVLFVAYGAPQQDKWVSRNLERLGVPVAMGVGGAFDFISGRAKRAPRWVQHLGLEWLHRLYREPWRWRRMLALPRFVWLVLLERLAKR